MSTSVPWGLQVVPGPDLLGLMRVPREVPGGRVSAECPGRRVLWDSSHFSRTVEFAEHALSHLIMAAGGGDGEGSGPLQVTGEYTEKGGSPWTWG